MLLKALLKKALFLVNLRRFEVELVSADDEAVEADVSVGEKVSKESRSAKQQPGQGEGGRI